LSAAASCIANPDAAATELIQRRLLANGLLAAAFLLCALLYVCPPETGSFYPACPIYEYLGIACPGCGATRALAALLHGQVAEAVRFNALFVVLSPLGVALAVGCYRRAVRAGAFRWPELPGLAMYGVMSAAMMFMVVRNLGSQF
jgi:hypothetical protein